MKNDSDPLTVPVPTREEIAQRAHQIYVERGCQPGHANDDWLQAEYELLQLPVEKLAEIEPPPVEKGSRRRAAVVSLVRAALILGATGLTHLKQ